MSRVSAFPSRSVYRLNAHAPTGSGPDRAFNEEGASMIMQFRQAGSPPEEVVVDMALSSGRKALRVAFLQVALAAAASLFAAPCAVGDTQARHPAADGLSIDDAVALALSRNEFLLISIEDRRRADAAVKEAYAGALPNIELRGSFQYNFKNPAFFVPSELAEESGADVKVEIGSDYEVLGQIRLDQVLYAFGRVGNAIDFARVYKRMASLSVDDARSEVTFAAKQAYYRVLLASQVLEIKRRSLRQAQSQLEEVERKLSQGTVSRFDFLRARVEKKNREPEVIAAENDLSLAMQDLKRILAIEDSPDPALSDTLAYVPFEMEEETAVAEALSQRPEVRSLELNLEGRGKLLAIEKAQRFPILGLFGQVLLQGEADDVPLDVFDERHRAISSAAGIALTMPIFDGFRTKARIQQASADLRRAEHELDLTRKAIRLETVKAVKDLRALELAYEAQIATVDLAEETYSIARTRFRNGLSTQLELTDAETALEQARVNYARTLFQYDVAVANLEQVLGRIAGAGETGPE